MHIHLSRKPIAKRTKDMISVLFLALLWLVPICHSQVLNATLDVPTARSPDNTVYLSDSLPVDVIITLDPADLDTLEVLIKWSNKMQVLDELSSNLTVSSGSNINITGSQTQQIAGNSFRLSLGNIRIVNDSVSDPLGNQIIFTLYVYIEDSTLNTGDGLNITGQITDVLDTTSKNTSTTYVVTSLRYGGPEVETLFEANGFTASDTTEQFVTVDREVKISVDFEMPPLWSMDNVVVHLGEF